MFTLHKHVKESAANVKRTVSQMRKAAEQANVSDMYGKNGPAGRYAFDMAFPGLADDTFAPIAGSEGKAANIRKAFKYAYGKADGEGRTISTRMGDFDKYFGARNTSEAMANIFKAAGEWDGKGDAGERITLMAQDTARLLKEAEMNTPKKEPRKVQQAAERLNISPDSTEAKTTADLMNVKVQGKPDSLVGYATRRIKEVEQFKEDRLNG